MIGRIASWRIQVGTAAAANGWHCWLWEGVWGGNVGRSGILPPLPATTASIPLSSPACLPCHRRLAGPKRGARRRGRGGYAGFSSLELPQPQEAIQPGATEMGALCCLGSWVMREGSIGITPAAAAAPAAAYRCLCCLALTLAPALTHAAPLPPCLPEQATAGGATWPSRGWAASC